LLLAPRFFFDILSKLFKNMVLLKSEGLTSPVEQTVAPSQSFQLNQRHTIPATNPGDEERDEYHTEKEVDKVKRVGTDEPVILEAMEQLTLPTHISPRITDDDDAKSHISNESTAFCFHSTLDETYPEVNSLGEAFGSIDFFCCKEGACFSSTAATKSEDEASSEQCKTKDSAPTFKSTCKKILGFEFPSFEQLCKEICDSAISAKSKGILRRMVTESESFDEDEYYGFGRHPPQKRRSGREIYADIRDLQHDRLTAQPEMLVDIDLAIDVLRDELRSVRNTTRAAYNNAEDEEDVISIWDSISSIHHSISKIEKAAKANAEAFSAIAEQNRAMTQSVQTMQRQLAMLTHPIQQGKGPGNDKATKVKKVVWKQEVKVKNMKKGKGPGDDKETKVKTAVKKEEDDENDANDTKKTASASGCD
jgi:hypothetical protein